MDQVLMRFMYTVLILLTFAAGVSWLNYRLLARIFMTYRSLTVKYIYLFLTAAAILVLGYGWTRRPPFVVPEYEIYHYLVYGALFWIYGQLILLVFQPLLYVAHRLIKGHRAADLPEQGPVTSAMTRREFLHNTLAVTPLVAFGISASGIFEAQTEMVVQRYSLVVPELPPNLNGLKIGQVSDTHLGPYFNLFKLNTVIQMLSEEKPDLVVITGDFADDLKFLKPAIDRFNDLQPAIPYGVYFCMGNHDYFRNAELVRSELAKSKIGLMDNSSKLIVQGSQPFYLLGVDYPWEDFARNGINISAGQRKQFFAEANQDVPPNAFKVLIGHHPDVLFDGFAAQIPLTLAGHTHGGQVVLGGKTLLSSYHYMRGLYRENGVLGYVSSGAGQWMPFRLGCPPEISVFSLYC